jgi:hypothetical protein
MMESGSQELRSEPLVYQLDITLPLPSFSQREQQRLRSLHQDYQVSRDFLGARELEQMRFLRWLYSTGRLVP